MNDKALSQEPCDDARSIEAVIEWLKDKDIIKLSSQEETARKELKALSPVMQKSGKWIRITNGAMKEKYICSECGRQIENDGIEGLLPIKYPYCHCGAYMVEPQESEE